MSWILIQRMADQTETYFESGTGWVSDVTLATAYSTKEASLPDGVTQREALGQGARVVIKDKVSGTEFAVPQLKAEPYLNQIAISPASPGITAGNPVQMKAIGTLTDGTALDITNRAAWSSATPAHATVSQSGLVSFVAAGTSVITAAMGGASASTTATAS
jgi:Bacterial Ig-like domain (group 2)